MDAAWGPSVGEIHGGGGFEFFGCDSEVHEGLSSLTFRVREPSLSYEVAMQRLEALDEIIAKESAFFLSLADDGRTEPTSMVDLLKQNQNILPTDEHVAAFVELCERLVSSTLVHFPGTIFWDHDCLLGAAVSCAAKSTDPVHYLRHYADSVEQLYTLYGAYSAIKFQYVHDFIYGYDFERWTKIDRAAPEEQQDFSLKFLQFLIGKGRLISRKIEAGEPGYDRMEPEEFRNTYSFERDVQSETNLFETLGKRGLLPIAAWQSGGEQERVPKKEYRPMRKEVAEELQQP